MCPGVIITVSKHFTYELSLMHGFKVHFRSPISTAVKKLSVRPFSIFPSHFPSLLQIGREGSWINVQEEVWESERINKLNLFQFPSSYAQAT